MRKLIAVGLTAMVLVAAVPGFASASTGASPPTTTLGISKEVGLPLAAATSDAVPPPGFTSNAQQALAAAKANATMQALHRRHHPLDIQTLIWGGQHWFIVFSQRDTVIAQVDVSSAGKVTAVWTGPQATAVYTRGHYAPIFDAWWIIVPFSVLFLVPFLDPRRWRRMLHLDGLVLLSFLVSYYLFDHAHLEAAVWLAYPPLLYLVFRMIRIGTRGRASGSGLSSFFSARALGIGLLLLMAARIGLSLASSDVIDVGYASVVGAHHIDHGQALYYAAASHGDTYGPIAYLAYVPFELAFPWHGAWDYLASAHAASIAFDLVTVIALVLLGRRLRPGHRGRRLGLALGWAWAACPFTLLGLMMHTNDGLIAMLSVISLLVFSSPAARGAVVGLAAAAKFSPAALLPLFASHRNRSVRGTITCVAAFGLVVAVAIGLYLPSGGLSEFYNHTIGYQLNRADVFSPWALHPGLDPLKVILAGGAILLAGLVAFVPRERSIVQIAALAAAVTIAVQLPAVHWFYYYIIWFAPFALVALLVDRPTAPSPGDAAIGSDEHASRLDSLEPALVGV